MQQVVCRDMRQQVTHARLFRSGKFEEQQQELAYQFDRLRHLHSRQWRVAGAAGQTQQQVGFILGSQPQVMGVFAHGQGFTTVQLQGELGRQRMQRRSVLQQVEQLAGQRAHVHPRLRVEAGGGAEQQIAHVIGGGHARAEAGAQQGVDQRAFLARQHAANLQVAAVGQLQHATGTVPGRLGNRPRLGTAQHAAGQLDAADAAIQRGDDA